MRPSQERTTSITSGRANRSKAFISRTSSVR
nr:MAG TPA: hypothetical protein [Myoviridae sp. ctNqw6]